MDVDSLREEILQLEVQVEAQAKVINLHEKTMQRAAVGTGMDISLWKQDFVNILNEHRDFVLTVMEKEKVRKSQMKRQDRQMQQFEQLLREERSKGDEIQLRALQCTQALETEQKFQTAIKSVLSTGFQTSQISFSQLESYVQNQSITLNRRILQQSQILQSLKTLMNVLKAENQNLKNENSRLLQTQEQFHEKTIEEKRNLSGKLSQTELALSELQRKFSVNQEKQDEIQRSLDSNEKKHSEEIQRLESTIQEREHEKSDAKKTFEEKIQKLTEKVDDLESDLRSSQEKNENYIAEGNAYALRSEEKLQISHREEIERIKRDLKHQIDQLEKKHAGEVKELLDSHESDQADLAQNFEQLSQDVANARNRAHEAEILLDEMRKLHAMQIEELQSKVQDTSKVEDLRQENDHYKSVIEQYRHIMGRVRKECFLRVKAMAEECKSLKQSLIDQMQHSKTEMDRNLARVSLIVKKQSSNVQDENLALRRDLEDLQDENLALRRDLEDLTEEHAELMTAMEESLKKFAEAEITSQTQNNSLTFALQKQNMKCFELEKQMEMKQNEIELMKAEKSSRLEERRELKAEMEKSKLQCSQKGKKIRRMEAQYITKRPPPRDHRVDNLLGMVENFIGESSALRTQLAGMLDSSGGSGPPEVKSTASEI